MCDASCVNRCLVVARATQAVQLVFTGTVVVLTVGQDQPLEDHVHELLGQFAEKSAATNSASLAELHCPPCG